MNDGNNETAPTVPAVTRTLPTPLAFARGLGAPPGGFEGDGFETLMLFLDATVGTVFLGPVGDIV